MAEKAANVAYNQGIFESRLKGHVRDEPAVEPFAILLGIDDVSQMLLFAETCSRYRT